MKHYVLALEILGLTVAVLEMLHAQQWVSRIAKRVREAGLQTSYAATLLRTSIVPLFYPAEIPPWWLDIPASILFFFFAPFVAVLALLPIAHLFGETPLSQRVALMLVGIPLLLSCLAYLFGGLVQRFLTVLGVVVILVSGSWRAPRSGYWEWCNSKIRNLIAFSEHTLRESYGPTEPSYYSQLTKGQRIVGWLRTIAILWAFWPAHLYSWVLLGLFFLLTGLIYSLSSLLSFSARITGYAGIRLPFIGVLIETAAIVLHLAT